MYKAVRGLGMRYRAVPPDTDCSCWSESHISSFHLTAGRLAFSDAVIEL